MDNKDINAQAVKSAKRKSRIIAVIIIVLCVAAAAALAVFGVQKLKDSKEAKQTKEASDQLEEKLGVGDLVKVKPPEGYKSVKPSSEDKDGSTKAWRNEADNNSTLSIEILARDGRGVLKHVENYYGKDAEPVKVIPISEDGTVQASVFAVGEEYTATEPKITPGKTPLVEAMFEYEDMLLDFAAYNEDEDPLTQEQIDVFYDTLDKIKLKKVIFK